MSRLQISGRIRQSLKGESGEKLKLLQEQVDPKGKTEGFDHVFESTRKFEDIYATCFSQLVQHFFQGHNVSVIVFGESNSGQMKTLFGGEVGNILKSNKNNSGLIALLANDLFKRPIDTGANETREKMVLKLSIVKIKGNSITDVMVPNANTQNSDQPHLVENELEGMQLKNVIELEIIGAKDCLSMIESSLSKLGVWEDDCSSENEDSTILIQFEMARNKADALHSWFRIFKLPGAEKLMNNPPDASARPQSSSLDIHAFGNVVMHLSECSANYQVPNYRESILTTMLSDVLGGNCFTNCLVTFKPIKTPASAIIMRYALRMKNILNYPLQNTPNSKNILRRYRWMMRRLQSSLNEERYKDRAYIEELKDTIAAMETKMKQMQEDNDKYETQKLNAENQLASANRKYAELTSSRTEISSRMVSSEQEKLKLSKEIIDLQLVNNTIKQEAEKQIFELKQKSLSLEGKVSDLERSFALEKRGHQDQKDRIAYLKQEHRDLSEEYINLKGNYETLSEEHQNLVNKNETLVGEIAKLADTKEQIIKHKDHMEIQQLQEFTDQLKTIARNVSQESKSRRSSSTLRLRSSNSKRLELEKQLLYNVQEREEKLESIREEHKIELKKLEEKLISLREELIESKEQAEKYKMKMAEQNSELLIVNEDKKRSDDLCKTLDEKLNETSQEYCTRLETYIADLKGFIWSQQGELLDKSTKDQTEHLENMIDGLKKGHKADKEILESKMKRINVYIHEVLQRHERLLTAYKLVLWRTGVGGKSDENIERDFEIILPPIEEIKDEQMKERSDLKTKLYLSQQNVKELQEKVDKLKDKLKEENAQSERKIEGDDQRSGLSLRALRRDMHDFTVNVQVDLEKERAELITRCTLAEQQVAEYEDYIDTYVRRYQHEIVNLRKMLSESGRLQSADGVLELDHRPNRVLPPLQNDRPYRLQQRNSRY